MAEQKHSFKKSVYKLMFNKGPDLQNYTVKHHIALLFLKNRSKFYKSQDEIKNGLAQMGTPHSQGAISRCLSFWELFPFEYHNQIFAICYTPKGYCLLPQEDYSKSLLYVLNKKDILAQDSVFFERGINLPQMFIFWIQDDNAKKATAMELFKKALQSAYLDIFYIENRLIILLNPDADRFHLLSKTLQNFFSKDNKQFLDVIDD